MGEGMKIELEPGVWLADGDGDPARTLNEQEAKDFPTLWDACHALTCARKYRPFKDAVVTS